MRTLFIALAALVAACAPASGPQSEGALTSTPMEIAPISRCMNLGGALEAPRREGEWGYTIRRDDLVRLYEAGFDTVRLPVKWSSRTGYAPPYAIDTDFLNRVDEIVRWAGEIGLNIIVNVHHYDELNSDPDLHEARLEAIWDQLAYHYATAPDFLIFETINEPNESMTPRRTDALNQRLMARIRQDNPDRWVILGTANWGNLDGLKQSKPTYDRRAMLTYHDYSPFEFTHQGAFWTNPPLPTGQRWGTRGDITTMMRDLDTAVSLQARHRMPVFVGEFGVYEEVPVDERARWTRAMREGLEQRGLGWCYWDYATTLKAYDLDREAWIPELLAALVD